MVSNSDRQWRLIIDSPMTGARNMAIDEAILNAVSSKDVVPTLRLYQWEPFCLSLGHAQSADDADETQIKERGWQIVRRRTGGRAILHGDELTYSVTVPLDHFLAQGSIVESYRRISGALLCALDILGVESRADRQERGTHTQAPVCFEVPSNYEITSNGKKLVGSAQLRRKFGLLQHGSLPLIGDIARICDALVYPDETEREAAKQNVHKHATTLQEVLQQEVPFAMVADAIAQGFERTFDIELSQDVLKENELKDANILEAELYKTGEWTSKR